MARVSQKKSGRQDATSGPGRGGQVAKQRKKQKVVLESVTKEKNQLRNVLSFRADPPPGYTFIPAGNPELTAALKEFARAANHKIFSVTTTPHASRHELSREVHRIGFHFPTEVVSQVCAHYGIRLTSGGRLIEENKDNNNLFMRVYQKGQLVLDEKVQDQITINTDAKQTIKDLFPNIPDKDLFQIIKTAFQLGDGKVGTADEIPLVRRAQLSVVAHIRHIYTEYDKLLRRVPYNEARHRVEKDTLKKLVEWRGDDDKNDDASRRAVDDVFKEVIVISDQEDSDSDGDDAEQIGHENLRIEELSSNAYGSVQNRPLSPLRTFPADDAPTGYRFVPQVARRYRPTEVEVADRDRSRYAIWDQARQEYRSRVSQPGPVYERIYLRDPVDPPRSQLVPLGPPSYSSREHREPVILSQGPTYESRPNPRPDSPPYLRPVDGARYEPVVARHLRDPYRRPHERTTPPFAPMNPNLKNFSSRDQPRREQRRTPSLDGGDGTILPSIENASGTYLSPRSRQNPFENPRHGMQNGGFHSLNRDDPGSQQDPSIINLTNSAEQQNKRRRVDDAYQSNPFLSREQYPQGDERSQMPPPRAYPERQIIDLGEQYASPRAIMQRPYSGPHELREPLEMQPRYAAHEVQRPMEVEQPIMRRILLPEEDARGRHVDDRVSIDAYGRRVIYEDRAMPEQVRRIENDAGHQRVVYTDTPPRRPFEAIRLDRQYLDPQPMSREYAPMSQYERAPIYPSHGLGAPNLQRFAPPPTLDSPLYSIHRRYEELPQTTDVRN